MPLKAVIDKLEDVAEPLRGEYRPGTKDEGQEGRFVLNVEGVGGFRLEDVEGLKSALSKERAEKSRLEGVAKAFEGLDAAEVRRQLAEIEDLRKGGDKDHSKDVQAKLDALQKQLVEKHSAEMKAAQERLAKYESAVKASTFRAAVKDALSKAEVLNGEAIELKLRSHLRLKETGREDDPYEIEVVNADGTPMIGNSKGDPQTVEGFLKALRDDPVWATAFRGTSKTGTGANGAAAPAAGSKTMTRAAFEQLSPAEKAETIKTVTLVD